MFRVQKRVQKHPNRMVFHTEKDLKSKRSGEKSLYFSQGCHYRKKMKSKPNILVHPNSGS